MFIVSIVLICFFSLWLVLRFIKKHYNKFTSNFVESSEPEVVQEEVKLPPVKKKKVYKKRVKKGNKE